MAMTEMASSSDVSKYIQMTEFQPEKWIAPTADDTLRNIQGSNEQLANQRFLTYNYGPDWYNQGRRLVSDVLYKRRERQQKSGEIFNPDDTMEDKIERAGEYIRSYGDK